MKFTLSADSLSSWDSIYEDDQEKLSEVPELIKKLASQGKFQQQQQQQQQQQTNNTNNNFI